MDSRAIDKKYRDVMLNYRNGINKGLYKIMSKMGISTIASYRCSKLFEAVGLHRDLADLCFRGVVSRIGGASFSDFQQDLQNLSKRAAETQAAGARRPAEVRARRRIPRLQPGRGELAAKAVHSGEYSDYQAYAKLVNERPVAMLRDLLAITPKGEPIPVDQVEPAESLFKRFDTAAMSIGALSPEAHESLAIAMNGLGGFSNSGEGGEDPVRYRTNKVSRIKQVASGRFGVTPAYRERRRDPD